MHVDYTPSNEEFSDWWFAFNSLMHMLAQSSGDRDWLNGRLETLIEATAISEVLFLRMLKSSCED
jgi:hypothetical protein